MPSPNTKCCTGINKLLSQMFECLDKVPGASQDEIAEALRLTGWNTASAVKLLKIQKLGLRPPSQWNKRIRREIGPTHTKVKISNQLPDSFTLLAISQVSSDVPDSLPPVPPAQRDISPVESVFSSVGSPVHSREATPVLSRAASPPASPRARPVGDPGGSLATTARPVGGPGPGGSLTTTARPVGDPRGSCTTTVRPVESRRAAARPERFLSQATVPQAPVKPKPARYRITIHLGH